MTIASLVGNAAGSAIIGGDPKALIGTVASVFPGGKQIGDLVASYDFSKINVNDSSSDNYLHCDLAPSYGNLNENLAKIDDRLKVLIAGVMVTIGKMPVQDRSWDNLVSAMLQNPLMEPDGDATVRADSLMKNSSADFKTDGSPDSGIVREVIFIVAMVIKPPQLTWRQVESWFKKLIGDDDILGSTKIDINVLGRIVASSGATIEDFVTLFSKKERHEKDVLDIGVLRFPDLDHPHFRMYRIHLKAWSDCTRILFHQEDKNGITGEFACRNFKPRQSIIDEMTAPARAKAVDMANAMFG